MPTTNDQLVRVKPRKDAPAVPRGDNYFAKAVGKAFRVLEIFAESKEPLSLNDARQLAHMAKTSVFRIIHTLSVLGYLEKSAGDRYTLSPTISALVPNRLLDKLLGIAVPRMRELGREFRETISLAFLFRNHIEVVEVVESPHKIHMWNMVGSIIPPHASSLGKSISAGQPEWRRDRLLRAYGIYPLTPHTITDEVELKKDLDLTRARGYSRDLEESAPGGCCFGAPIFADGGYPVAAISISTPLMRLDNEERVISAVQAVAQAISDELKNS
ncbi:MAG TPA: IclR family transcriptional regulator [Terriglobia bacterium]|nr:IclR family transcriptional regulator [Terriglobia bacterium]